MENYKQPTGLATKSETKYWPNKIGDSNDDTDLSEDLPPASAPSIDPNGNIVHQSTSTIEQRLEKVKELHDRCLISEEEASGKRKEILDNL